MTATLRGVPDGPRPHREGVARVRSKAWPSARSRRSVPTTSGACSDRPSCSTRGPGTRRASSTTRSCGRPRTPRSATSSRSSTRPACDTVDRRRVPAYVVAHGLHLPARGRRPDRREARGALPQRRRRPRLRASAGLCVDDRVAPGTHDLRPAFDFLQRRGRRRTRTPKLTIPSPSMVHYRGGRAAIDESVYPDLRPFWDDLSAAYAEQVRRMAERGCTYLQLDDTSLAYLNDPEQRANVAAQGGDAEHQHERYIRKINAAIADRPEGLRGHHAHVPRQLPLVVGGRGRLRLRRRGAVLRARRGRLLPGVRRRALRRLRAAAVRARGQAGRARPGHHQEPGSSRTRTTSSAASTRPRSTSRSSSSASRPSAASRPQWRATS